MSPLFVLLICAGFTLSGVVIGIGIERKRHESGVRPVINTHEEATYIVERFEDTLDHYDISVPSPEDYERDPGNSARLYGSVYSDLLDSVENDIIDILDRNSENSIVITGQY